jgi:uncharacterized protein (TIGR02996 family)
MDQNGAFLQAILEAPEDDAPRLIYADWLDEHGNAERAEFIRVQITAEHTDDVQRRLRLEDRAQELLAEHEAEWVGPLPDWLDFWAFRRGWVEEAATTGRLFLSNAGELFRLAPVRVLHLRDLGPAAPAVLLHRLLGRLRHLDLSDNPLGDVDVCLLARSAHLSELRGLNLGNTGVRSPGAQALADSPHLAGLTELYLSGNAIDAAGQRALERRFGGAVQF